MERFHYILLTPFVLTLLISPHGTFAEEDKCEGLDPVFSSSSLVVRYGDPVSVTCSAPNTTKTSMPYSGMGLEAKQGGTDGLQENVMNLTWSVSSLTEWEEAQGIWCFSTFEISDAVQFQCITNLSVTIYNCKVGDNCTVEETVDVADLPIFAGGAASAILVLMVALGVVLCVHYRKTRMGHYMMKNILPDRINRHITHSKESEQSQL